MKHLYKLTDTKMQSYGGTQWGLGVRNEAAAGNAALCTKTVIHAYRSPEEAVLFNPIHSNFANPLLWECPDEAIVTSDALKVGVKALTTTKQVPLPCFTSAELVRFGIYCVPQQLQMPSREVWRGWAEDWLSGKDRSAAAAAKVAEIAWDAREAAWAAWAAAEAAEAGGVAAGVAAVAAAVAAKVAEAARAAAGVAWTAANNPPDFVALIKKAVADERATSDNVTTTEG